MEEILAANEQNKAETNLHYKAKYASNRCEYTIYAKALKLTNII